MNKIKLIHFVMTILFVTPLFSEALPVDKYPTKEIRWVISNSPGTFPDLIVRPMQDILAKNLGVPIVLYYKAGSAGVIGTQYLINSKPDGYTIGTISSALLVVHRATVPDITFSHSDLSPLCKYAVSSNMVYCKGDAPWKTVEELVSDAKRRPGEITYAAYAQSVSAFIMEGFQRDVGIKMKNIPMSDSTQAAIRVMGGNIDIGIGGVGALLGQLKAGTLRALFVVTPERVGNIPQVPTLRERGYRDPIITIYEGIFAPLGIPNPIRETLEKALEKTIKDPALKKALDEISVVVDYIPAGDFDKGIEEDYKRVKKFIETIKSEK